MHARIVRIGHAKPGFGRIDVGRLPADRHGLDLDARVMVEVDAAADDVRDRCRHDDRAMVTHQGRGAVPERSGQRTTQLRVSNEQVGHAGRLPDVEHRHAVGDERRHVIHGAQRDVGVRERNERRRVAVDDGVDVGTGPVDLAVNEALEIRRATGRVHRVPVEIELQDVGGGHQLRRHRPREQKTIGSRRMPDAHVSHRVEDVLHREDPVRRDEVLDERGWR